MYRTNEATLSSITNNLEKLRECFGNWVNLSIESESKVLSRQQTIGSLKCEHKKLNLENYQKTVQERLLKKYILEKKLKRDCVIFDLHF